MKYSFLVLSLLLGITASGQCADNVKFISITQYDNFTINKIAFVGSDGNIDISGNLFLEKDDDINVERFLHKEFKDGIFFPFYYSPKSNDVFILTENLSFFRKNKHFSKFLDSYEISEDYFSKIQSVKTLKRKRGWKLLRYSYLNVHVLELEMTIGSYNQKTFGAKIIGDFDTWIKVKFIL